MENKRLSKEALGKFIVKKRIENGLSREELANKVNVSYDVVWRWESGKRFPDFEMLGRLSDALGVTVQELYDSASVENNSIVLPVITSILVGFMIIGACYLGITHNGFGKNKYPVPATNQTDEYFAGMNEESTTCEETDSPETEETAIEETVIEETTIEETVIEEKTTSDVETTESFGEETFTVEDTTTAEDILTTSSSEDEDSKTPTGYPSGQMQEPYIYYRGKIYKYNSGDSGSWKVKLPEDATLIGLSKLVTDMPDEDFELCCVPDATEIYYCISNDKIYYPIGDGYYNRMNLVSEK